MLKNVFKACNVLMSGLPVGGLKGATKLKHSGTSFLS